MGHTERRAAAETCIDFLRDLTCYNLAMHCGFHPAREKIGRDADLFSAKYGVVPGEPLIQE